MYSARVSASSCLDGTTDILFRCPSTSETRSYSRWTAHIGFVVPSMNNLILLHQKVKGRPRPSAFKYVSITFFCFCQSSDCELVLNNVYYTYLLISLFLCTNKQRSCARLVLHVKMKRYSLVWLRLG